MLKIFYTLLLALTTSSIAYAAEIKPATATPLAEQEISATEDDGNSYSGAVIQILNKTNAKAEIVETKLGKKISFGQISIVTHKCWQSPLDQRPESKMLLEIFETKSNQPEKRIFYGWMFASSPSISGLEHPVYDITALNCKAVKQ